MIESMVSKYASISVEVIVVRWFLLYQVAIILLQSLKLHGQLDHTLAVSRGRRLDFAPLRACPSYLSKHSHTPSTHISNTSFVEKRLLLLYLWCNQLCIVASHTCANLLDLPSPPLSLSRSDDSTDDADGDGDNGDDDGGEDDFNYQGMKTRVVEPRTRRRSFLPWAARREARGGRVLSRWSWSWSW